MKNLFVILFIFAISVIAADAQIASGGSYTVEKSVIAGGGAASAGGNFTVEGTIGQNSAGTKQQNASFTFQPGFWNAAPNLIPTAASVTVGGRVLTADGRGIRNVLITIMSANGESRTVISGTFGYYKFNDVAAGGTYIVSVRSKRFTFNQPTQVLSIFEETDDIIFTANNENQTPAMSTADSPQP